MRIVINHLTRMTVPRICAAGVDPATGDHIRPTTPRDDLITRDLLRSNGGPLTIGAEVDLGDVDPEGSPPETEDHQFETGALQLVRDLTAEEFLQMLEDATKNDLEGAFGPALKRRGWKYAVDVGEGTCSLAVIRCKSRPSLDISTRFDKPKLELRWQDPDPQTYLPVTDLRFFRADQRRIDEGRVSDVAGRLRAGVGCFLMLGLARPWSASHHEEERHWLQLNGLVLEDRAVGDLP